MKIQIRSYDGSRPTGSVATVIVLDEPKRAIFAVDEYSHRPYSFNSRTGRELNPCSNSEWRIESDDLRKIQEQRLEAEENKMKSGNHRY